MIWALIVISYPSSYNKYWYSTPKFTILKLFIYTSVFKGLLRLSDQNRTAQLHIHIQKLHMQDASHLFY